MPELDQRPRIRDHAAEPGRVAATYFRSGQSDYELHLSIANPDSPRIEAVGRGEAEFALVIEEPEVLILFRFGDAIPWSVAYHDRHGGPDDRGHHHAPETVSPPERPAHLDVFLADAGSQEVRATRSVVLWLDFTHGLDAAIREQARSAFDPSERRRAMSRLARRFPGLEMLAMHAKVRSPGCA